MSTRPPPELHHLSRNGTELLHALLAKHPASRPSAASAEKDWAAADAARDALTAMGIEIKDGAQGTTWRRIVQ